MNTTAEVADQQPAADDPSIPSSARWAIGLSLFTLISLGVFAPVAYAALTVAHP